MMSSLNISDIRTEKPAVDKMIVKEVFTRNWDAFSEGYGFVPSKVFGSELHVTYAYGDFSRRGEAIYLYSEIFKLARTYKVKEVLLPVLGLQFNFLYHLKEVFVAWETLLNDDSSFDLNIRLPDLDYLSNEPSGVLSYLFNGFVDEYMAWESCRRQDRIKEYKRGVWYRAFDNWLEDYLRDPDYWKQCIKEATNSSPLSLHNIVSPAPEKKHFNINEVYENLTAILNDKTESFSDYLFRLIDEKKLKDSAVYKSVEIDRTTFAKLRNPDYHPGKRTVLSLIIGTQMSTEEAGILLEKAGYSFKSDDKTDLIVKYFVENKVYELRKINEALDHFNLEPLLPRERPGKQKRN